MKTHVVALRVTIAGALNLTLWWIDRIFEWLVYPWYIGHDGFLLGMAKIMLYSLVLCIILLLVYDWVCSIDPNKISPKRPRLRALVEACNDVLGYETIKELGGSAWDNLFRPVTITPARRKDGIRVRWWWFLKTAHDWHLGRLLRYVRKAVNALRYAYSLVDNLRLRAWEPIRRIWVAPAAEWMSRHRLQRVGLFLAVALSADAMTTTIVMRPAHSHKMGTWEWTIFSGGLVLSCIGWGMVVAGFFWLVDFLRALPWGEISSMF